jgi:hypothetical protein
LRTDVRAQVVIHQHAGGAEHLQALIVSIRCLPAIVDVALLAARGAHHDHRRVVVVIACADFRVHQTAGGGEDFDRLFTQQPASHVEVMDGHVAEQAARCLG